MSTFKKKILIINDDPQMERLLSRNLQMEGYITYTASDWRQSVEIRITEEPTLILLDFTMVQMNGYTAFQRLRETSPDVPMILITPQHCDKEQLLGQKLESVSYLIKPFSVDELLLRVRCILHRAEIQTHELAGIYEKDSEENDMVIDTECRVITYRGKKIDLTPIEYQILAYMLQNAGRTLTQNMLLEHVWGAEYIGEYHMLQVNINRLRRKIEADSALPLHIITKSGIGYVFVHSSKTYA